MIRAAFLTLVIGMASCGYRPIRTTLHHLAQRVCIAATDTSRIDEPRFATFYQRELARELMRRNIAVEPDVRADIPCFRSRVLALGSDDVALSGARVGAEMVVVRLEVSLGKNKGPAWRSGMFELRERRYYAGETLRSEELRKVTVLRLAQRSATEVILRWTASDR